MKVRGGSLVLLLTITAAVAVGSALGAAGVVGSAVPGDGPATSGDAPAIATQTAENNSTMGEQISTFMQSSAGDAGESVDAGMWDAAIENASGNASAELVERRIADIRQRLDELDRRKQALETARENGSIDERTYRARMSRLVGQMAALNRSIERVDRQADETGVNRSAVDDLRDRARNISDEAMSDVARSIGGGPPDDPGRDGPPDDSGPPDDGPPDDGPPDDCPSDQQDDDCPGGGDGQGNDDGGEGPSDDGGNGGEGGGPPDDAGGSGETTTSLPRY